MDRMSRLEESLAVQIKALSLPEPVRELRFDPKRRWRFDFAWADRMVAIEVEGGSFAAGRHVRPTGFEDDCEKYNSASLLGWRVLRVTSKMVKDGRAARLLEQALS